MIFCCLLYAAATAKSLQSCPTLCDPIDGSPPGSPVPGILQARTLEWARDERPDGHVQAENEARREPPRGGGEVVFS